MELSEIILASILCLVAVTVSIAAIMVLPVVGVPGVTGVSLQRGGSVQSHPRCRRHVACYSPLSKQRPVPLHGLLQGPLLLGGDGALASTTNVSLWGHGVTRTTVRLSVLSSTSTVWVPGVVR